MTHSYVKWLSRVLHAVTCVRDVFCAYVTWFINMWYDSRVGEMTHSYMTALCVRDRLYAYVTYRIDMWHDSRVGEMTRS